MTIRNVDMDFQFMNTIPGPPKTASDMYQQACSNDTITVNTWRKQWVEQTKANRAKYGPFKDMSITKLFGKYARQPVIVAGSGPSLKRNIAQLRDTKGIPVLSCLHNFHYMVDNEVPVELYVSLDAGEVTIEEISEGGQKTHAEYIEATKGKTLAAFAGSHPKLLESWKGDILFFNCPIPNGEVMEEILAIDEFNAWVSTGGNVLGATAYIAKAIMGCNPLVFVGADFCFSYTNQFHPWNSKYDGKLGTAMRGMDVYGNRVLTWQSYYNFKVFFDWMVCAVPGFYVNCTEGGMLGAYPEGNIAAIQQMELSQLINIYAIHEQLKDMCMDPSKRNQRILY